MNRERAPQTSKRRCARIGRRGFTLVEMMVVIIVIAILAGLLLPAIGGAVRRAKNARIALEIASISQALERYKMEYGEYPPDFVPGTNTNATVINQHLSRVFRYRNQGNDVPDWKGTSNTGPQVDLVFSQIEPREALYFWLRGFSNSPQFPLSGTADGLYREGTDHVSMFSFDKSRLTDADGDGFWEYHPQGDDAERPYIYYRAKVISAPNSDGLAYDDARQWALAIQSGNDDVAAPYLSTHKVQNLATSDPNDQINAYAAPKKFQIISAGLGGVFGKGGDMVIANDGTRTVNAGVYPEGPYPSNTHYDDRDNLTNFSEGSTLKDAQE